MSPGAMACSRRVLWFLDAPAGLEAHRSGGHQLDRDDYRTNERRAVTTVRGSNTDENLEASRAGGRRRRPAAAGPAREPTPSSACDRADPAKRHGGHAHRPESSGWQVPSTMPSSQIGRTPAHFRPCRSRSRASCLTVWRRGSWPSCHATNPTTDRSNPASTIPPCETHRQAMQHPLSPARTSGGSAC
jgi:hypothetical protein